MVRIRKAAIGDTKMIAHIYVDTWRSSYAGMIPEKVLLRLNVERQTASWTRLIGGASPDQVYVAETEERIVVGFVGVGPVRAGPPPFEGEIYTLYVLDDHQGTGVGRMLLKAGFESLLKTGTNSALIWVLGGNPTRFFYEAMGGERVAERNEPLWGSIVHQIAYGWRDLESLVKEVQDQ